MTFNLRGIPTDVDGFKRVLREERGGNRKRINPGNSEFLIELKYVKMKELKNLESIKQKGIEHPLCYCDSLNS